MFQFDIEIGLWKSAVFQVSLAESSAVCDFHKWVVVASHSNLVIPDLCKDNQVPRMC